MKSDAPTGPPLPPEIRRTGQLVLCIMLALVFGALAALVAFVLGFLLMAAQGESRAGPLLMVLGTPVAFLAGAGLGWRWARRTVAASDGG